MSEVRVQNCGSKRAFYICSPGWIVMDPLPRNLTMPQQLLVALHGPHVILQDKAQVHSRGSGSARPTASRAARHKSPGLDLHDMTPAVSLGRCNDLLARCASGRTTFR